MKFIKYLFLLTVIIIGFLGFYIYTQNEVKIPNSMVTTAVKAKFPMEKSYPAGKIKLYNPKSYFKNNKLFIEVEYLNDALNDKIKGTMTFETDITYDFIEAKLFLKDLHLVGLTKDGKTLNIKEKPFITFALNLALNQLEKKEILNLSSIEKFQVIKDIKINNDKIVVIK